MMAVDVDGADAIPAVVIGLGEVIGVEVVDDMYDLQGGHCRTSGQPEHRKRSSGQGSCTHEEVGMWKVEVEVQGSPTDKIEGMGSDLLDCGQLTSLIGLAGETRTPSKGWNSTLTVKTTTERSALEWRGPPTSVETGGHVDERGRR